jgi:hypothetical protein
MVLGALAVLCGAGAECCITIAKESANSSIRDTTVALDMTTVELGVESTKAMQLLWNIADNITSCVLCAVYSAMYYYAGPIAAIDSEICPISAQDFKAR